VFWVFCGVCVQAQQFAVGLKLTGLSIHPGGATNAKIMKYKLDSRGIFVFNPGVRVNVEYFVYKDIVSIKIEQGLYKDCANQLAGFTHIGFRGKMFQAGNHSMNGGVGPTIFFRKNWYALDGYTDAEENFKGKPTDRWQRWFIWWGGEFEYNYRVHEGVEVSTSFVPCIPPFVPAVLSAGTRIKPPQ
jgi:hypothetical protein